MAKMSSFADIDKATSASIAGLSLDPAGAKPLRDQLANALKRFILERRLPPGSRLPASRGFAEELGVSRATIMAAFDELIAEGYAEGRRGSGLYVVAELPDHVLQSPSQKRIGAGALVPPRPVVPFQAAAPELVLFPHEVWAKLMHRIWRAPEAALLATPDPLGWAPLRIAIAQHLNAFRGMNCEADQIAVTSGTAETMEILIAASLRRGDRVALEEPGYPLIHAVLREQGLAPSPIAIDGEGLDITRLRKDHRAVLVTPSRHYPLGLTMPLARRLALADWARTRDAFILEDDYDSEYRYRGNPLPALMSIDDERVMYLGSFSKTLMPGLRLGFCVVPRRMIEIVARTVKARGTRAGLIMQPVLAEFIRDGHYATHIRRMRRLYARRQAALISALERHAAGVLTAEPDPAGMHLVCDLVNYLDDRQAARRAAAAGLVARPLSEFYAGPPQRNALMLGYAGFDEATLDGAAARLAAALQ